MRQCDRMPTPAKPLQIPAPEDILLSKQELQDIKTSLGVSQPIRQLSRITVAIADVNYTNKLQRDENIRKYDLISIQPTSDKLLQVACQSLEVDIICMDLTQKLPFKVKRSSVGLAVDRGIMFEVQYCPLIRDTTLRRFVISNAVMLCEITKGKNIIVTSGCENAMELRGPYDVHNLSQLFGLSEVQAKSSNTVTCHRCITHGETAGKRAAKCIVSIVKLPDKDNSSQDTQLAEPPTKKKKVEKT